MWCICSWKGRSTGHPAFKATCLLHHVGFCGRWGCHLDLFVVSCSLPLPVSVVKLGHDPVPPVAHSWSWDRQTMGTAWNIACPPVFHDHLTRESIIWLYAIAPSCLIKKSILYPICAPNCSWWVSHPAVCNSQGPKCRLRSWLAAVVHAKLGPCFLFSMGCIIVPPWGPAPGELRVPCLSSLRVRARSFPSNNHWELWQMRWDSLFGMRSIVRAVCRLVEIGGAEVTKCLCPLHSEETGSAQLTLGLSNWNFLCEPTLQPRRPWAGVQHYRGWI